MADRDARLDPAHRKIMLINLGYMLRKANRLAEAASVEAKAAAIRVEGPANAVVDVSELVDNRKAPRK